MIESVWRQARTWGTRLGDRVASQETALTNARRASTVLLRRRVERDEVAIFLDDLDDAPAPAREEPHEVPAQRAVEPRR